MDVVQINSQSEFITQMDKLYCALDVVFFMDYDLKGNMARDDFFERINIKYALRKDKEKKKIWFYTSGPRDIKGLLLETFPGHVIRIPMYSEGQLYWEKEQVKAAVEGLSL